MVVTSRLFPLPLLPAFLIVFLFSSLSACCGLPIVLDTRKTNSTRVYGPDEITGGGCQKRLGDVQARHADVLPHNLSPVCLNMGPGNYVF